MPSKTIGKFAFKPFFIVIQSVNDVGCYNEVQFQILLSRTDLIQSTPRELKQGLVMGLVHEICAEPAGVGWDYASRVGNGEGIAAAPRVSLKTSRWERGRLSHIRPVNLVEKKLWRSLTDAARNSDTFTIAPGKCLANWSTCTPWSRGPR